jgi:uncharacterized protein YhhL (DUF1145 family)
MSSPGVEGLVIALTTASTISTICIHLNSPNPFSRNVAVFATLAMMSVVLIIEVAFHYTRPRSEDLYFNGPEGLVIFLFVIYEILPIIAEHAYFIPKLL